MLAYFVLAYQAALDPTKDYLEFLSKWLVPRMAIVALVQFVGFFFLRLYVANELDIKHNKNELTNVESKLMAYAMAKSLGANQVKVVIEELAKTERNFVLKKNEKTLSHENLSEFNDLRDVVQKLAEKIPSKN